MGWDELGNLNALDAHWSIQDCGAPPTLLLAAATGLRVKRRRYLARGSAGGRFSPALFD